VYWSEKLGRLIDIVYRRDEEINGFLRLRAETHQAQVPFLVIAHIRSYRGLNKRGVLTFLLPLKIVCAGCIGLLGGLLMGWYIPLVLRIECIIVTEVGRMVVLMNHLLLLCCGLPSRILILRWILLLLLLECWSE
jgi:ribose/xylose/arabinose/galactoside ABC-type transport system permease subunit